MRTRDPTADAITAADPIPAAAASEARTAATRLAKGYLTLSFGE
jgi:hypothetical protein